MSDVLIRLKLLRDRVWKSAVGILVGNKAELQDRRAVEFADAEKFANEHDLKFVETSATAATDHQVASVRFRSYQNHYEWAN